MPSTIPFVDSTPTVSSQRLPRYLTQGEVRDFLCVISSPRDKALFAFVYLYALRVGEVPLHRRSDIDFARHRIVIKRQKGGFWTERPLFSRVEELFQEAGIEKQPAQTPLFAGRDGPLRKRQIQSLFTRYRNLAGLSERYTTHGLRHSMATHLIDAGEEVPFVQDHLGHRDIRSTLIYARVTDSKRNAVFQRLEHSPWIVHPQSAAGQEVAHVSEKP